METGEEFKVVDNDAATFLECLYNLIEEDDSLKKPDELTADYLYNLMT